MLLDENVAGNILKNETAKYNIHIQIKLVPNIHQILKSDIDKIDPIETSNVNRIKCSKYNKTGYYISFTKRKIKGRIKEHKGGISNNREKKQ